MIKPIKVKAYQCKCERCGFEWVSEIAEPVRCKGCKSPYWNKEKRQQTAKK